ncbi:MAG: mannose-6-phosphate isomerase, class I [Clostridia bacterium]|nr:mannose-6-phosphate isomerase, class I [Clostridia bacterium]
MAKAQKLIPEFKDYLWGGNRLKAEYHKQSPFDITAESWELSCHKNGLSRILGGEYDGLTLPEAITRAKEKGEDWLGTACERFEQFPVLIKLIDACDSLSIQVHPDDAYAKENENGSYGKTEVWYIVDCEPDAELIYGFSRDVSKEELKTAIENNELSPYLNRVKVKPGDVFFVRAGLLHAIGKGILICEIQQNSDTTYRVYDWGRVGADGKPRELHIAKAVEVLKRRKETITDFSAPKVFETDGISEYQIATCEYFKVKKREQEESSLIQTTGDSFIALTFLNGEGMVSSSDGELCFIKGETVFLPATEESYTIKGKCEYLMTSV